MNEIAFGPFVISLPERRLWRDGVRVRLKAREAELLAVLVERRHRVIRKDELIEHLWGGTATDAALAQTMYRLRQKLGQVGGRNGFIKTIPSVGFQFTIAAPFEPRGEHVEVLSPAFACYQRALEAYRQRTPSSIDSAIQSLENLQTFHPHFLPPIVALARAYTVMGIRRLRDPQESYLMAQGAVKRILDNDPRSPEAHATLALLLLFYDGDREQAHRAARHAMVLAPHSSFARKAVFWDRLACRDFSGALRQADLMLRSAPGSAQSMALLATALYMCKQYDPAQKCFAMALELDPLNCTALYYAASTCVALEDYDRAETLLRSAASAGVAGAFDNLRGILAARRGDRFQRMELIRRLSSPEKMREPSRFLHSIDPLYAPFASFVKS